MPGNPKFRLLELCDGTKMQKTFENIPFFQNSPLKVRNIWDIIGGSMRISLIQAIYKVNERKITMSASRQKKLRKETPQAMSEAKQKRIAEEQKSAKRIKIWSTVFYFVIAAMVIGLVAVGFMNTGIIERNTTAAVIGDYKLSAAELNYFFAETINNDYMLPYIADSSKPLDQQEYSEGVTLAEHYLDQALENARAVYAAYEAAMNDSSFTHDHDHDHVGETKTTLKAYAKNGGFATISGFLRANYGKGSNWRTYKQYLEVNALAQEYSAHISENLTATADEIAAKVEADPKTYSAYSYAYVTMNVDEYYAEDAKPDAEGKYTEEQTAAAKEAALKAAEAKAQEVDGDVEAMRALEGVKDVKDAGYSSIPADLREWVSAEERKEGEVYSVMATSGGAAYVAMYIGSHDNSEVHLVNVRHVLIAPKGEPDKDGGYSDAQMEGAKAEAEELLNGWLAGDKTEDSFAKLANEKSTDTGSNTNGGLYEDVYPGQMVTNFNDWCFDESRKPGDTGIVESDYGYHIMYFVGNTEQNYRDYQAEEQLLEEKYNTWYDALLENCTVTEKSGIKKVNTSVYVQAPQTSY